MFWSKDPFDLFIKTSCPALVLDLTKHRVPFNLSPSSSSSYGLVIPWLSTFVATLHID